MMNIKVVGGAVVIGFIVLAAVYYAGMVPGLNQMGTLTVRQYDADGNPLPPSLAYARDGTVVSKFDAVIKWTATSEGGITGLIGDGSLDVVVKNKVTGAVIKTMAQQTWQFDTWSGTQTYTYLYADLCEAAGRTDGWTISLSARLHVQATDSNGDLMKADWTGSATITILWTSGALALYGQIGG